MTSAVTADDDAHRPGRVYTADRRVRLGDVSPGGRLRLDAILRYLQDVGDDDTIDAGFVDAAGWVVRRTVVTVMQFAVYQERLRIETWCSGLGGRWAQRSTRLVGDFGALVDTATIWVHIDPATFRAVPLPESFAAIYGPSAAGRRVSAKLFHDPPPRDVAPVPWALRFADFDVMGHVNNAVVAELLEEQLARRRELRAPLTVSFEYRHEVTPTHTVDATIVDAADTCSIWLSGPDGDTLVSAVASASGPQHEREDQKS